MATWKPKPAEPVGANEVIGRRLFDEPKLAGAQDQKSFAGLDLRNFTEKRDRQFSVDRLGRTGVEGGVLKYLRPRGARAAARFRPPKRFDGWATLRAKFFTKPPQGDTVWPLSPSPIPGEGLDDNIYHAHITLPEGVSSYTSALQLRELFAQYGDVRREGAEKTQGIVGRLPSWVVTAVQKAARLLRRS